MTMRVGNSALQTGAGAYARVGVESGVLSATPHHLIVLLFDGLQLSLRTARLHMKNGNVVEKSKAVSRALDILNQGLRAALDVERGGEIAVNLDRLYDYTARLLLQASLHNDTTKLDEVERVMNDIGTAWREIGGNRPAG